MSPLATSILIGVLSFAAGALLGAFLYRMLQTETAKNRRLTQQVDKLREEQTRYQAEVSEHFEKTAQLFGKLNSDYREVLSHLASGAEKLADDQEISRRMSLSGPQRQRDMDTGSDEFVQPPRDYAPKAGPDDKGTLAEDFGLDPHTKP